MAEVYKNVASVTAHLPGVRGAVAGQAEAILGIAQALFAPHNRPGRHEISVEHDELDSLVVMTGPVPQILEYGRSPNANGKDAMRGLHILGRAAGI